MGYIVHFADLANFDRIPDFREACRYAKAGARDHRGAAVYEDRGAYHGDVLRAWDERGRRISVGNDSARSLGARGGHATAAKMSPEQRKERARKAASARWAAADKAEAAEPAPSKPSPVR